MVRSALVPFTSRGGLGFEPAIDRVIARALDVPVWSGGAELAEAEDHVAISVDVPGVRPDQVTLQAEGRTLTLTVTRDGRGAFTRQYTIGPKYDITQASARLEHGVLTLTLPKSADAQPRAIPITIG